MPIAELGDSINSVDADTLAGYIRKAWDKKVDTKNREDVDDGITLSQWGKVIINRKLNTNIQAEYNRVSLYHKKGTTVSHCSPFN